MTKKFKDIEVCNENSYNVLHDNVLDFLEWLTEQINSIPIDYQHNARIDIDSVEEYGVLESSVKITYTKPKTNKELKEDAVKDRELRDRRIDYLKQELSDLESY